MSKVLLALKATYMGLGGVLRGYVALSISVTILLVSMAIAMNAMQPRIQYGLVISLPINYTMANIDGEYISLIVANTAYAKLYSLNVTNGLCIAPPELLNTLLSSANALGCRSVRGYSRLNVPVVILFTNSSTKGGVVNIPENPVNYFSHNVMAATSSFLRDLYAVMVILASLSSTYLAFRDTELLKDTYRRLKTIVGWWSLYLAITYIVIVPSIASIALSYAESWLLNKALTGMLGAGIAEIPAIQVLIPILASSAPMIAASVISWRASY